MSTPHHIRKGGITFGRLIPLFMASCERLNLRFATLEMYRLFGDWMINHHGSRRVVTFTRAQAMRVYEQKGRGFTVSLVTLFRWARRERLIRQDPTVDMLPRAPRREEQSICFLTPGDAFKFLEHAPKQYRAAFILGLWAGIRPMETCRIEWQAINITDRRIKIDASVSKTRHARMIEGIPDILWRLLAPLAKRAGRVVPEPKNPAPTPGKRDQQRLYCFDWHRQQAGKRAGVKLGHDVLRHTFATYFVALRGDASPAAKILGHQGLSILIAHYDGVATKAQALEYFRQKETAP